MRVAAIDIGSYTVQMSVATVSDEGAIMILGNFSQDSRLIQGMDVNQLLSSESIEFCLEKISLFQKLLKGFNVVKTRAVGTAALRNATNAATILERAQRVLGEPIEILPEGEESAYVYLACHDLRAPVPGGRRVVIDVGGGSTEIAIGDEERLLEVFSIPQGAARLARRFLVRGASRSDETVKICEYLDAELDLTSIRSVLGDRSTVVLGCGSTATGVATLEAGLVTADHQKIHGTEVTLESLVGWLEALAKLTPEEQEQVEGLEGERGDVMLAGLALWIFLLEKLGATSMVVSDFGLRHGVIREILGMERPIL